MGGSKAGDWREMLSPVPGGGAEFTGAALTEEEEKEEGEGASLGGAGALDPTWQLTWVTGADPCPVRLQSSRLAGKEVGLLMSRLPLLSAPLGPAGPLRMLSLTAGARWTGAVIAEQGVKDGSVVGKSPSLALPGLSSLACLHPLVHVLLQELSGVRSEQPDASRMSR